MTPAQLRKMATEVKATYVEGTGGPKFVLLTYSEAEAIAELWENIVAFDAATLDTAKDEVVPDVLWPSWVQIHESLSKLEEA